MSTVKVLVVDDSATMRGLITAVLRRDPEITVVGQAGDPLEARDAIKRLNPDVVTLDIEMPVGRQRHMQLVAPRVRSLRKAGVAREQHLDRVEPWHGILQNR